MPDSQGRIPPVAVPELPWMVTYAPGDRIRVCTGAPLEGSHGTVLPNSEHFPSMVLVDLDHYGEGFYRPGELRYL